jgi:glutamate racemase
MDNPIGIFDSGIGGLTVVKQLIRILPDEHLVYFGDTARLPYGTKSEKLIKQFALEDAAFLEQFGIKYLVVACNSASSVAVELLQTSRNIPVTGVIEPGVMAALKNTKNKRIGVIGTTATIMSDAYHKKIMEMDPGVKVFGQPCPLLVPLVEEGWLEDDITRLTVQKYMAPLLANKIDTLILGCTHFPVIKDLIQDEVGAGIRLIDSGEETALVVKDKITALGIRRKPGARGEVQFYVSDIPKKFDEVGTRFLGHPLVNARRVDFDNFIISRGDKIYSPLETA